MVKFLAWSIGICLVVGLGSGIIVSITGSGQPTSAAVPAPPKKVNSPDSECGPIPNRAEYSPVLYQTIKANLNDPESLQDLRTGEPVKSSTAFLGKRVKCWKVRFSYRAKNGFNALRVDTGTVWVKDDLPIQLTHDQ